MTFFGGRRRRKRTGVGTHLAAIFGVCFVSLAVIIGYTARAAFQREQARAVGQVGSSAQFAAAGLSSQLSSLPTFMDAIAAQPTVASFDPVACNRTLTSYAHFGLGFVSLVEPDGSVVCTSEPAVEGVGGAYAGQPWLARAAGGRSIAGAVTTNPLTGRPAFLESVPVAGPGGRSGMLVATLDPAFLSLGAEAPLRAAGIDLLVLDPARHVIMSASGADQRLVGASVAGGPLSRSLTGASAPGPDGVSRLYSEATVKGAGWHVVGGMPTSVALAAAWGELWRNLGLGAVTLAVVALLGLQLRRRISRPIRSLTAAIERSGKGQDAMLATVEGPAELARVAEAFNTMVRERKEFEDFLSHLASHDGLTNLPNRSKVLEHLSHALAGAPPGDTVVAVAFLDLDRFKLINDSHGHSVGDRLLNALAARLQAATTGTETVGRFGGDEFVVVDVALRGDPAGLAERMTEVLSQPFSHGGDEIFLSGSIGIAVSSAGSGAEEMLAEADAAMYRAKEAGIPYAVFDAQMRSNAASRLSIEAGLHRAIERSELVLHYQPAVRLSDGALAGVEALVRWHRPGEGLVPPGDFIPVAEQTGLIVPIGSWVLREACRQVAAWRRDLTAPNLRVSVNVSARQLTRPGFRSEVAAVLAETGLPAEALSVEITESALIDDVGSARSALDALRALGVTVSVDDFGTGYSSLSYLQNYPVDELKIDRSFVARLDPDGGNDAIVRSVVDLAHSLGMTVVAEGVEVLDQLLSLRRMGCDVAQGFYISRPVPGPELELALAQGRAWELTPVGAP